MFDNKKNANVLLALTGPLAFCMASFIDITWYSIKAAGVLLVFSYCSAIGIVGFAASGDTSENFELAKCCPSVTDIV
jgi:hypothetical protein